MKSEPTLECCQKFMNSIDDLIGEFDLDFRLLASLLMSALSKFSMKNNCNKEDLKLFIDEALDIAYKFYTEKESQLAHKP